MNGTTGSNFESFFEPGSIDTVGHQSLTEKRKLDGAQKRDLGVTWMKE